MSDNLNKVINDLSIVKELLVKKEPVDTLSHAMMSILENCIASLSVSTDTMGLSFGIANLIRDEFSNCKVKITDPDVPEEPKRFDTWQVKNIIDHIESCNMTADFHREVTRSGQKIKLYSVCTTLQGMNVKGLPPFGNVYYSVYDYETEKGEVDSMLYPTEDLAVSAYLENQHTSWTYQKSVEGPSLNQLTFEDLGRAMASEAGRYEITDEGYKPFCGYLITLFKVVDTKSKTVWYTTFEYDAPILRNTLYPTPEEALSGFVFSKNQKGK